MANLATNFNIIWDDKSSRAYAGYIKLLQSIGVSKKKIYNLIIFSWHDNPSRLLLLLTKH